MKKVLTILVLVLISLSLTVQKSNAASTLQEQINNAPPGSTIYVTEDYTEDITINKDITLIGTNRTINGTFTINNSSNVTLKNLNFIGNTDNYLINILGSNNIVTLDTINVTNTGNGVLINDDANNTNLTITNSNITSEKAVNGRALGIRGPNSNVIIENNSILNTTGGTGACTVHINIGSITNTANVEITNSTINSENYYAYFVWQGNINTTIQSSKIRGYSAIYLKLDSVNTINIKSSSIIGLTRYSGPSDDFGAIVFENQNNILTIGNNSTISNEYINNATSKEYLILFSDYGTALNNTVNLSDTTLQNKNNTMLSEFIGYNLNLNSINITDKTKFIDQNSNPVAITRNTNGILGNAYSSFENGVNIAENNSLVLQLQPGTYITSSGQKLEIKELTFLAFSESVKNSAQSTFPTIALANFTNNNLTVYANSISIKGGNVSLYNKTIKQLEVLFNPEVTTDKTVNWSIADTNIATISNTGLLSAKNVGTTTLTITSNGISSNYTITVLNSTIIIISLFIFTIIIIILFIYLFLF